MHRVSTVRTTRKQLDVAAEIQDRFELVQLDFDFDPTIDTPEA